MKLSGNEIRQQFLEYFEKKHQHTVVPSTSLVPGGDQTLLFTNAGMVQFKDVFLGTDVRQFSRAVNSQKCMRVAGKHNDLDDVGRDDFHHTFFEMLGNWSFGDYYKKEAITWAWELLTEFWNLDRSKLWVTVFQDEKKVIPNDDDAAAIWKEQPGIDLSHILHFGRKDNLWEMAETGPCGPSSEIHFDFGPQFCEKQGIKSHKCQVNGDCHRYVELWNLVFIQYNRVSKDEFLPLPMKHVDTGMGFERIVSVLQCVTSNYKTDLLMPLILRTQELTGETNEEREVNMTPYRVIADHARAAAFLIADGVIPGNTSRNYVCRMIIRRAARFGGKIGLNKPFLAEIAQIVIKEYSGYYPELERNENQIINLITREEEQFQKTLGNANQRLEEMLEDLKKLNQSTLDGESCFELYATHGLPLEITKDILSEKGFFVDENGFMSAMDRHKVISSSEKNEKKDNFERTEFYQKIYNQLVHEEKISNNGVEYNPYGPLMNNGTILAIIKENGEVENAIEGDEIGILMPATPFYIESGGQVSDHGTIQAKDGKWRIDIESIFKPAPGIIVHKGKVMKGEVSVDCEAVIQVDEQRRNSIMRNHSATHLLHASLHRILGDNARQAGSLVADDRLRFDFTYPSAITIEELRLIEEEVNKAILAGMNQQTREENLKTAMNSGAMALFGEKYGNQVRTVTFGKETSFSYELCGGTHVANTSQIGLFLILSETSAAAGIRRIEAVTGWEAYKLAQKRISLVAQTAKFLNARPDNILQQIMDLDEEYHRIQKDLKKTKDELIFSHSIALLDKTVIIEGISLLAAEVEGASPENLRSLIDQFKHKHPDGIAVLATIYNEKPFLIVAASPAANLHGLLANQLANLLSPFIEGKGGGNESLAQAGGRNTDGIKTLLEKTPSVVSSLLK